MKTYDLTKPNRKKKFDRMHAKKDENLFPHYAIVERVPEKGTKKRAYQSLVTIPKALRLLKGKLMMSFDGKPYLQSLSREFTLA